jgi:hypothetical protein
VRAGVAAQGRVQWCTHQENRKALVDLATRPNQSQTRAKKTRPDQQDDQSARGPLCLEPEVAHNVSLVLNVCLNHQFFSDQNNKTKPEHQSLPLLLMQAGNAQMVAETSRQGCDAEYLIGSATAAAVIVCGEGRRGRCWASKDLGKEAQGS